MGVFHHRVCSEAKAGVKYLVHYHMCVHTRTPSEQLVPLQAGQAKLQGELLSQKPFFARLLSLIPLCEVHERFSLRLHSFRLKPACMPFGYVFLCFAGCITLYPYRTVQG